MKIGSILKRTISAFASAALIVTAFPPLESVKNVSAADTVVVDINTVYQTVQGFGGINLPEWAGSDMTSDQLQTAFGNGYDELGLTILRVYVSDDESAWKNAVPTAKNATAHGAKIFASPWNPPASMCETFTRTYKNWDGSTATQTGQKRLKKSSYADYAKHLNSYIKYMKEQGVDIYAISIQNEPDYAEEWTWWTPEECVEFIEKYGKTVVEGTDTLLMSPETFQYNKEYYNAILNSQTAYENVGIFGTHFYGTQRSQMDFPALENCGKNIWMTEVYVPNSTANSADNWPEALEVSENIHNGLVVGNMNAYVWWFIRRSYSPMKEDGTISKRGYCMAQYSKYVRPGDVRIDATEQPSSGVYVSAYKNNSDEITIVAVNKGGETYSQGFSLKNGEIISEVDRFRTSANENLAETSDMDHDKSSFFAQLPANSVSTFVVTLGDEGNSSTSQPSQSEDYIFNDTFDSSSGSWEGRGAAGVRVNDGVLEVTGRDSSWNGASKNLSTSTFVPGKSYSFSVIAMQDSSSSEQFKLTLQYKDADGKVNYSEIASTEGANGEWVQLANTNYTIPSGASDLVFYVETIDTTVDFSIDNAVAANGGTVITATGTGARIRGDYNMDGEIDIFDVTSARQGIIDGKPLNLYTADTNGDGEFSIADVVLINQYVLAQVNKFPEPVVTTPPVDTSKWDNYKETASTDWINFYKSSIKNMGNTSRLAKKLSDAENGKSLTLAYLGGSITEGKNYSSPLTSYIKSTFAKGSFKEINAGLSGTSSVVGLVRSEKDIFSANPDIVVLEFSVNDHEGEMYKKCFESLVRKTLEQPNEPAVIILINRSKGGFSSQSQMYAIGKNYDVPVISMDDALTKAFNSGFLKADDYFQDEYHPHANGGKLVSDCMSYFLRQAMKSENQKGEYKFPSSDVYGSEYKDCYNASASDLTNFNAGSFKEAKGYSSLPYGYEYQKGGTSPMTFTTEGKGLIIVFKANSSGMGSITVTVNGKSTKIDGNKLYTWGGPDAELGYYQNTSGKLDVSIKADNSGADFTIWGIGVIK